jgi:hypothetical protein
MKNNQITQIKNDRSFDVVQVFCTFDDLIKITKIEEVINEDFINQKKDRSKQRAKNKTKFGKIPRRKYTKRRTSSANPNKFVKIKPKIYSAKFKAKNAKISEDQDMNQNNISNEKTTDFIESNGIQTRVETNLEKQDKSIKKINKAGRKPSLNLSELAIISIIKSEYGIRTNKHLYKLLRDLFSNEFNLPTYKNFICLMNKYAFVLYYLVQAILGANKDESHLVKFVDSTPVPVCKNIRIGRHKTMKDIAKISKSTTGWYYGLKLHVVKDYDHKLVYVALTLANVDDRKELKKIFQYFKGSGSLFVTDKGYLSEEMKQLAKESGNYLLTGVKSSPDQKGLASWLDIHLIHNRASIETIFSVLKERLGLVSTIPRSVQGYIAHYINTIFGYLMLKTLNI